MGLSSNLKDYLEKHWDFRSFLSAQLGAETNLPEGEESWNFGDTPTEKISLSIDGKGRITRIRTYSGMNWSARGGYGSPVVDISGHLNNRK